MLDHEVQDTLRSWGAHLDAAALWFVNAPGANSAALYSGRDPPLTRNNPRIRSVPFPTRRPTFSETKRVVAQLLTVSLVTAAPARSTPAAPEAPSKALPHLVSPPADSVSKLAPEPKARETPAAVDQEAEHDAANVDLDTPLHRASRGGQADLVRARLGIHMSL